MADLIEREKVVEILRIIGHGRPISGKRAISLICEMPTAEQSKQRHGQWIEKPPYEDETVKGLEFQIVCSECDEQNSSITFDENSVPIAKTFYRTRYCPHCGADMRGGVKNDSE